ncbi:MAG: ABC transporter ATP-binding protein/permease [Candidatus Cardinium sp.]|nr:ABC transporter ATP-binding protein/permease [Candidatus Cardinium sp.]
MKRQAFCYFMATFLSIFFGLITYSLVIPLLKVLFNQEELNTRLVGNPLFPKWQISIDYLKCLFDYFFMRTIISYGKIYALGLLSLLFMVSTILNGFFRYMADIVMAKVRIKVVYRLRLALFKKMLTFPLQRFTDKKQGDLMACITTDIQEIDNAVADTLRLCCKEPTQLFCYIAVLFYMSFQLSLFTLLWLPIAGWIIAKIIKQLRKWADRTQQSLGDLMHLIEAMVSSIRIIKIFGAQNYAIQQFKKESRLYARINRSIACKEHMTAPISESLSVAAISIILVYGGYLIFIDKHALSPSTFIAYFIICTQTLIPIKMMARSIGHIQRGLAAGRRALHLLDEKTEWSRPLLGGITYTTFKHAIAFNNVSFAYSKKRAVLTNVNFTIQRGETVAIVGASGSGKSTLLSLLSGLYQPSNGTITIDNFSITQFSNNTLPRLMGVVTQESILFHDTIYNNIVFNRPGIPRSAVIGATQIACAHPFIMELPQGYDTVIGEQGGKLSGGQKQCICIARAVLGNPPILVLDEATSALDRVSEKAVQSGLQSFMQHRTAIIVAHRLSSIYHVDRIIVLDQGKIVEEGTHATLLAKEGIYKRLFHLEQP